jgi:hypothetical protein
MENKMDSLFKKKLESHSLPPREDAWVRIESGLSKKNKFPAWKIAAALLVAGALITAGIASLGKKDAPALANQPNKPTEKPSSDSVKDSQEPARNLAAERKSDASHSAPSSQKKNNTTANTETFSMQKKEEESASVAIVENEIRSQKEIATEQNLITDATALTQTTSTPIEKPIKLEFTLEEVVEETAVAKTETKNSGLKKMLDAARQIKNGEGPVTQLLEKKDELFAFNFKKEKQKTQH